LNEKNKHSFEGDDPKLVKDAKLQEKGKKMEAELELLYKVIYSSAQAEESRKARFEKQLETSLNGYA